jgi:hypothetical protein
MSWTDREYNAETETAPLRKRKLPVKSYALRAPRSERTDFRERHTTHSSSRYCPTVSMDRSNGSKDRSSPTLFYLFCILAQAPPEIASKRAQYRFGGFQGPAGSASSQSATGRLPTMSASPVAISRISINTCANLELPSERTRVASMSLPKRCRLNRSATIASEGCASHLHSR